MLTHKGSYQRTIREDVTLQTYRDDHGAHLLISLPAESRHIDVELPDSECDRLARALDSIKEEVPF